MFEITPIFNGVARTIPTHKHGSQKSGRQGRNQLIFRGGKRCNFLLYLNNTYVFENFVGGNYPNVPLWLRAWWQEFDNFSKKGYFLRFER